MLNKNNMANQTSFSLPTNNTPEENAKLWVEQMSKGIEPGKGIFFNFKDAPELRQPVIDYCVNMFGWSLEYDNTFLRKPLQK